MCPGENRNVHNYDLNTPLKLKILNSASMIYSLSDDNFHGLNFVGLFLNLGFLV